MTTRDIILAVGGGKLNISRILKRFNAFESWFTKDERKVLRKTRKIIRRTGKILI